MCADFHIAGLCQRVEVSVVCGLSLDNFLRCDWSNQNCRPQIWQRIAGKQLYSSVEYSSYPYINARIYINVQLGPRQTF